MKEAEMSLFAFLRRNRKLSTPDRDRELHERDAIREAAPASRPKKISEQSGEEKKAKRRRRPAIEVLEERFLKQVAATNPQLFTKIMSKRFGLTDETELEAVAKQIAALRKLERTIAADEADATPGDSALIGVLKAFASAAGQAVATNLPAIAASAAPPAAGATASTPAGAPVQQPQTAPALETTSSHL